MSSADDLAARFEAVFGAAPDGLWQAPGRVNLIGEHTDYNEGYVLPFAIDRSARLAVRLRPDPTVRMLSTFGNQGLTQADAGALDPAKARGWTKYPLGVLWALAQRGIAVPGLDLLLDSDVPRGAGLSSSHAIECAVILAVNELAGAGLSTQEMVLATQRAENDFVGAPTGIMDQSASLRGAAGRAVFLDCRDQSARLVPFDAEAADLVLLVIDTKVLHSHADGGYADRRASCEFGAEVLGVGALRDVGLRDLEEAAGLLHGPRRGRPRRPDDRRRLRRLRDRPHPGGRGARGSGRRRTGLYAGRVRRAGHLRGAPRGWRSAAGLNCAVAG
ncbi:galactokinase [Arthrobacter sp. UYEF3]